MSAWWKLIRRYWYKGKLFGVTSKFYIARHDDSNDKLTFSIPVAVDSLTHRTERLDINHGLIVCRKRFLDRSFNLDWKKQHNSAAALFSNFIRSIYEASSTKRIFFNEETYFWQLKWSIAITVFFQKEFFQVSIYMYNNHLITIKLFNS